MRFKTNICDISFIYIQKLTYWQQINEDWNILWKNWQFRKQFIFSKFDNVHICENFFNIWYFQTDIFSKFINFYKISKILLTCIHNFDKIFQFLQNFTVLTKFDNFWNLTFSDLLHNSQSWQRVRLWKPYRFDLQTCAKLSQDWIQCLRNFDWKNYF